MLKVKKQTLLIIAGIVWLIAGVNILRIGIGAFITAFSQLELLWFILLIVAALVIFFGFTMMFRKVVGKHQTRILGYEEEKKSVFCFFDWKGYLLMVFMMGLGIGLRASNLLPGEFFAFFYSGLGTALSVAGFRFIIRWIMEIRKKA